MEVAKRAFNSETGTGKLRGATGTDQEGDVASGGQQARAEVAARARRHRR